jgi:hypothetical protein
MQLKAAIDYQFYRERNEDATASQKMKCLSSKPGFECGIVTPNEIGAGP